MESGFVKQQDNKLQHNALQDNENKAMIWPFYFCFLAFGIMTGLARPELSLLHFGLSVLLSGLIGLGIINLLILLLKGVNKNLALTTEPHFAMHAVARGIVFMIPFTVLAVHAQTIEDAVRQVADSLGNMEYDYISAEFTDFNKPVYFCSEQIKMVKPVFLH